MELLLGSPDKTHVLALMDAGRVLEFERWEADAEGNGHLPERVAALLSAQQIPFETLTRLIVLTGPGSFTFSRLGVVTANAFRFAHTLPLLALSLFDLGFLAARAKGVSPDVELLVALPTIHDAFFTATGLAGSSGMPVFSSARLTRAELTLAAADRVLVAAEPFVSSRQHLSFLWDREETFVDLAASLAALPAEMKDAQPLYLVEPHIDSLTQGPK